MDRRPSRAWRPWLATAAAAWLAACQGFPQQLSFADNAAAPSGPGWRVVERLGDARYLAPSMAGWEDVVAGSMIPAGSQIATGAGGRLIVDHAASQLSAGTGSRFILPGWEEGDSVRQTAGWLRYRIATGPAANFGIETPFLDLVVDDAVLDVTVGESETEVAVVSGRVRVKTLDERRQIDLHAGYTGYASLAGDALAVRRGPDQGRETVPPIVVPALHPERAPSAVAPDAAGAPAIAAFAGRVPAADSPASAPPPAVATEPARRSLIQAPLAPAGVQQAEADTGQTAAERAAADQVEQIQRRFDGLTEGLLDGLLPVLPQDPQRVVR